MEKILGKPEFYHDQRNDASFELLRKYHAEAKAVNCFWNAVAFALEVTKWINPNGKEWKKIQFPDYALMVQYNTKHYPLLKDEYSWITPKEAKLNEFPKYGVAIANKVIFQDTVMFYSGSSNSVNFDIISEQIKIGTPVITSSHLYGGHFICFHAISNGKIGYSDSYNGNWLNWWTEKEFFENVKKKKLYGKDKISKDYCKIWFNLKKSLDLKA